MIQIRYIQQFTNASQVTNFYCDVSGVCLLHVLICSLIWNPRKWIKSYTDLYLTVNESFKAYRNNVQYSDICQYNISDRYECWIGSLVLSWKGKFYKKLEAKANPNNIVILAIVDMSYLDMAMNLYEGLESLQIENFLFICTDRKSFNILAKNNIDSFYYKGDIDFENPSNIGTKQFRRKVGIKLKIVTAAVTLGFDVLLTDIDVVFLRDPVPVSYTHLRAHET